MIIIGTNGNDNFVDGIGANLLGTADDDWIYGLDGDDLAAGEDGDDHIFGGDGMDILLGGAGDDHIVGGHGDDRIFGGSVIHPETEDRDVLYGGTGDDLIRAGLGDDYIHGGSGHDRVSFFINPALNPTITSGVTVSLMIEGRAQDTGYGLKTLVNIESLSGTAFDDALSGDNHANWLFGNGGNDNLFGNGGDDLLTVGAGTHVLDGGGGTDTADLGGNGGSEGPITVSLALQGTAQVTGISSVVLTSFENLSGSQFDDALTGDGANNVVAGSGGADALVGGDGNDRLLGDGLIAPDGFGPITTFEEDPFLPGGDDVLTGGLGQDALHGGGGADRFAFTSIADSTTRHSDEIMDFDATEGDLIDLSAIDSDEATAGDEAFAFIGDTAFSNTAGELRVESRGGRTFVEGDVDGDGRADFAIHVVSDQPIVASDFIM